MSVISNVLAERYASAAMKSIWSAEGRIILEREFWIAVMKAQKDLGLDIPDGVIEAYERVKDQVNLPSIDARERVTRHDVKARIEEFCELAGCEHIHKGMTSRDLTENVEQLQIWKSMQIIRDKAVAVLNRMSALAEQWKHVTIAGRTHNVAAQTTTMGKRVAMFGEDIVHGLGAWISLMDRYSVRGLKGAVGTQLDQLSLFGQDAVRVLELEDRVCAHLGIPAKWMNVGQVYPRSLDFSVVSGLVELTSGCSSFAKTLRLMETEIRNVDCVLQILDARIPLSSLNPEIERITDRKPKLYALNKADLADPAVTEEWIRYFHAADAGCVAISAKQKGGAKAVQTAIEKELASLLERRQNRGMGGAKTQVMLCGIPNVGKSTFINTFAGSARAKAADRPGVTKGKQWVSTEKFDLLDMPGVLWKKFDSKTIASNLAFIGSIKDDILDVEELAMNLLDEVRRNYPDLVAQRYKLDAETLALPPYELLEAIGRKRGLLVRGGEVNTERCAIMLVDEFRACKWGRISLERPPQRDDLADFAEEDDE